MPFIASIVAIGTTLYAASASADNAAAQTAANKEVDYSVMSPEAKAVLQGLFGNASSLASKQLGKDYDAIRAEMVDTGIKSAITGVLNQDIPGLKATLGKAGAYNSTSYGLIGQDLLAGAAAKSYLAANQAADSRIKSELDQLNPIIALLGLDKGSVKKGVDSGGGVAGVGGGLSGAAVDKIASNLGNIAGGVYDYAKS